MAEYVIRKKEKSVELAKFDETDRPIDVYTIAQGRCNCPSRYKVCKHTKIVTKWNKAGNPVGVVYDDDANQIGSIWL